jgi:hypothetical protein
MADDMCTCGHRHPLAGCWLCDCRRHDPREATPPAPPAPVDDALRELLHRADGYLSLLWHRHVKPEARQDVDLAVNVDRTIADLRRLANGGR